MAASFAKVAIDVAAVSKMALQALLPKRPAGVTSEKD
jgi:hypothetical protein